MEPHSEKRAHQRFQLLAQVQISREGEVHIMSALNISRGGLFISGHPGEYPELTIGATVELTIFNPDGADDDFASLGATVVRIDGGARPGFGLQFAPLGETESAALERLLEQLRRHRRISRPPGPPPAPSRR